MFLIIFLGLFLTVHSFIIKYFLSSVTVLRIALEDKCRPVSNVKGKQDVHAH